MAVLAAILPVVSRSSALALELYRVAAESPETAKELIGVASQINGFALILKQVGTIIKEDDRLPSPEVRLNLIQSKRSIELGKTKISIGYQNDGGRMVGIGVLVLEEVSRSRSRSSN